MENDRGRLSKAADARCQALAAEGIDIQGYEVSGTPQSVKGVTVEKVKHDPNRIADVPDPSRSESDWTAHTSEGPVGMRTVCNLCHSSLTYCWCQHPRVWVDVDTEGVVYFTPTR
jgi:uncharacterized Zn-finger protein